MKDIVEQIKSSIRTIPDWPKEGILFYDITTLLADPQACSLAIKAMTDSFKDKQIDYVAATEARGFIFGIPLAQSLNVGFIPIRKKGKLPAQTESVTYDLEYGTDTLEVHKDAVSKKGASVLIVDDLLATGGTMAATCKLIEKIDAKVAGISCLLELTDLKGKEKLKGYDVKTVIKY